MVIEQTWWTRREGWCPAPPGSLRDEPQLVFAFGGTDLLARTPLLGDVSRAYPESILLGCSTAGEIHGTRVLDDSLVVTAVRFEHTTVRGMVIDIDDAGDSRTAGTGVARSLLGDGLVHVVVISDGLRINGTELVDGMTGVLPADVALTGGLAADGERFETTLTFLGSEPAAGRVAAVGLYGDHLRIGYGSMGGWDPFGPERLVTRSEGSVLYELDGKSAVGLYRKYLGDYARDLPASGLLFPLSLRTPSGEPGVVRTILAVDDHEQSMTFAGDVPEGSYARLMRANFERLIDGASSAARTNYQALGSCSPDLALLISCVGRKMVLKQRVEEEVEAVREVFGGETAMTGFYSYGEISPFTPSARCELHNQTMTITTLSED